MKAFITTHVQWFFQLVSGTLEPRLEVLYLVNNHGGIKFRVGNQLIVACRRRNGMRHIRQLGVLLIQLQSKSPI